MGTTTPSTRDWLLALSASKPEVSTKTPISLSRRFAGGGGGGEGARQTLRQVKQLGLCG